MGRGRAKAKQTKVARELKYHSPNTDLAALQRELAELCSAAARPVTTIMITNNIDEALLLSDRIIPMFDSSWRIFSRLMPTNCAGQLMPWRCFPIRSASAVCGRSAREMQDRGSPTRRDKRECHVPS